MYQTVFGHMGNVVVCRKKKKLFVQKERKGTNAFFSQSVKLKPHPFQAE